jgi:protein involved in plasmid replication-relaxation
MQTLRKPLKGAEKLLFDLVELEYLTLAQVMKIGGYKETSRAFVHSTLQELVKRSLALPLPRQNVTQPIVYTPTTTGYRYAAALGMPQAKRIRPVDERDKAKNTLFVQHTLAISEVLIAAKLLARTHPAIELSSLYTERSLKRKIAVPLPDTQTQYIEPDAACEFLLTETWHTPPQTWQDFFHIEVYRHVPMESRFKQKVKGYVVSVDSGTHEALFKTEALSIAVICETKQQALLLKRWTEDALSEMGRLAEGERFFFRSIDLSSISPSDLYLSPDWQQAFGTTKTPLLVLE